MLRTRVGRAARPDVENPRSLLNCTVKKNANLEVVLQAYANVIEGAAQELSSYILLATNVPVSSRRSP